MIAYASDGHPNIPLYIWMKLLGWFQDDGRMASRKSPETDCASPTFLKLDKI